jgi:hypothetical protein
MVCQLLAPEAVIFPNNSAVYVLVTQVIIVVGLPESRVNSQSFIVSIMVDVESFKILEPRGQVSTVIMIKSR